MTLRVATRGTVALALTLGICVATVDRAAAETGADEQCTVGETRYVTDPSALRHAETLGLEDAWKLATGKGTVVAVIDSGVDAGNEHFRGDVITASRSFVDQASDDAQGHGTAVAGIIAAREYGQSVLVGAAPDSKVISAQVFSGYADQGSSADVAAGIRWAAEQDPDVINVSAATGPNDPDLPELKAAVDFALGRDIVVVAAAGNRTDGSPLTQVQYPAGFPGVIGVAGANLAGDVDDYSIHGKHVDVSAPGQNVLTTFYANGDCIVSQVPETSFGAAFVSALAAMLRERFPDDTAEQIGNRIMSTAQRPQANVRDQRRGWGLIQPVAALESTSSEAPSTEAAESESTGAGPAPETIVARRDPSEVTRDRLLWWALGATGVVAVALVARPLARSRRNG